VTKLAVLLVVLGLGWLGTSSHAADKTSQCVTAAGKHVGRQCYFSTPGPNSVGCDMGIGVDTPQRNFVYCLQYNYQKPKRTAVTVNMSASGHLKICHGGGCISNMDARHVRRLRVDGKVRLGPFRCTALKAGVACRTTRTVTAFLIRNGKVQRILPHGR
jgi:hypothetical protein